MFEVQGLEAGKEVEVVPRFILTDGDGNKGKGFKCEWLAVRGETLYAGSIGKEWVQDGQIVNHDPMFVKTISNDGSILSMDWQQHYESLRIATGTEHPGYMVHEAAAWHPRLQRWFFLPRRVSREAYDEAADEHRGSNLLISCRADFSDIQVKPLGQVIPTHGFSSFKFLPNRDTVIVALLSEEVEDTVNSYIAMFDIETGEVLLKQEIIGPVKFEGVEIVPL